MLIPHWAKAGQKVICVDDSPTLENGDNIPFLKKGETYVISDVLLEYGIDHIKRSVGEIITLKIKGIQRRYSMKGFHINRFRPLITLEDDMKLFEHLKNPSLVDKLDILAERMDMLYKE